MAPQQKRIFLHLSFSDINKIGKGFVCLFKSYVHTLGQFQCGTTFYIHATIFHDAKYVKQTWNLSSRDWSPDLKWSRPEQTNLSRFGLLKQKGLLLAHLIRYFSDTNCVRDAYIKLESKIIYSNGLSEARNKIYSVRRYWALWLSQKRIKTLIEKLLCTERVGVIIFYTVSLSIANVCPLQNPDVLMYNFFDSCSRVEFSKLLIVKRVHLEEESQFSNSRSELVHKSVPFIKNALNELNVS